MSSSEEVVRNEGQRQGESQGEDVPVLRIRRRSSSSAAGSAGTVNGGTNGGQPSTGKDAIAGLIERMQRETKPPEVCANCERQPPDKVVVSPMPGRSGGAKLEWWCVWCREVREHQEWSVARKAAAEEAKLARKKKRPTNGRVSAGRYGDAVMALAYRIGGFSARQL